MGASSSKAVVAHQDDEPTNDNLVWHDCIEEKPVAAFASTKTPTPPRRTSQLVADRLSWMQAKLLSPSSAAATDARRPLDQNPKEKRTLSELVAERKRLLEQQQQQKRSSTTSWNATASNELVAERLRFLEEQLNATKEEEAPAVEENCHVRSSELVTERARFLEEWSNQPRMDVRVSPTSAVVASDLVVERKKLLEEEQQKRQQQQRTQQDIIITSDLVTERARWLEERQTKKNDKEEHPSSSVQVSSELVSERARWLEEQHQQVDKQQQTLSSSRINKSLLEGLASERSKWLQWWSGGSGGCGGGVVESSDGTGLLSDDANSRPQPGKLDPARLIPNHHNTTGQSTTSPTTKSTRDYSAEAAVSGSRVAETRARFLAVKEESSSINSNSTPSNYSRGGRVQRWGENYMPHVEEMVENTGFINQVMVELEQEGLLPGFLAEHTSWLFLGGAASDDKEKTETTTTSSSKPDAARIMDLLRLDYYQQPLSTETPGGEPQSLITQEDEEHEKEETREEENTEIYSDPLSTASSTEDASCTVIDVQEEEASQAAAEDDDVTGIIHEEQTDQELFLDKANKPVTPWSEMPFQECQADRKEVLCSFCEIM